MHRILCWLIWLVFALPGESRSGDGIDSPSEFVGSGIGNALPQHDFPSSASVRAGATLNLAATVSDPDGDRPAVFLLTGPAGIKLVRWSATKLLLNWKSDESDTGRHRVVILLEDARDRAVTVMHEIQVSVYAEPL